MPPQERLGLGTRGGDDRFHVGDDATSADDRIALTAMLDAIEETRKAS